MHCSRLGIVYVLSWNWILIYFVKPFTVLRAEGQNNFFVIGLGYFSKVVQCV